MQHLILFEIRECLRRFSSLLLEVSISGRGRASALVLFFSSNIEFQFIVFIYFGKKNKIKFPIVPQHNCVKTSILKTALGIKKNAQDNKK